MYDALRAALGGDSYSVVEAFELAARPAKYSAIPEFLHRRGLAATLSSSVPSSGRTKHKRSMRSVVAITSCFPRVPRPGRA